MTNHLSYDVLSRMLERRVSPNEAVLAERHLKRCGVCRSEREWLERIRRHPRPFPNMPPLLGSS
jgi:hypothetical protein